MADDAIKYRRKKKLKADYDICDQLEIVKL